MVPGSLAPASSAAGVACPKGTEVSVAFGVGAPEGAPYCGVPYWGAPYCGVPYWGRGLLGPCDPERAMPTTMATIAAMPAAITISLNQPIPRTLKKPISDNNDETEARTIKARR